MTAVLGPGNLTLRLANRGAATAALSVYRFDVATNPTFHAVESGSPETVALPVVTGWDVVV